MATKDERTRADTRLQQAAAEAGCDDPRPPLRSRLRELKEVNPAAFERALAHYEQTVLPGLAGADEPLGHWVDYVRFVGELASPGRVVAIDGSGRAVPYLAPESGWLVLFLPEDAGSPVLVALVAASPTPAQRATVDLLVHRRLSL
jgi:hypothetical protein